MTRVPCLLLLLLSLAVTASGEIEPSAIDFTQADGFGVGSTFQVALADVDGDGDLDAFLGNMDPQAELWLNDGDATFTNSHQRFGHAVHGLAAGDLDGDGDLDLALVRASSEAASSVYLNDGAGRFTLGENLDDASQGAGFMSLFDLEGDGDLDISAVRGESNSIVFLNDGRAHFERSDLSVPGLASWGDLDEDGDADAIIEQPGRGFFLWWNEGHGFVRGDSFPIAAPFFSGGSALVDIDNDGDLDWVALGAGFETDAPLTILRNLGGGSFEALQEERFPTFSGWIAIGDFNGDSYPDLLASSPGQQDRIGLGDSQGGFIDSGLRIGSARMPGVSAAGDLDADGDIDILLNQYDPQGQKVVWLNTIGE